MPNKPSKSGPASIALFDPEVVLSDQRTIAAGRYIQNDTQTKPSFSLHAGLEIGVVLSGSILRWEGHRRLLQPGDVWFTGLFEPHGSAVQKAPCMQLNLAIWPDLLANLRLPELPDVDWIQPFLLPPASRPQIRPEARARILAFARHMPTNWNLHTPEALVRVRLRLIELLLLLREESCAPPPTPQRARALYTQLARRPSGPALPHTHPRHPGRRRLRHGHGHVPTPLPAGHGAQLLALLLAAPRQRRGRRSTRQLGTAQGPRRRQSPTAATSSASSWSTTTAPRPPIAPQGGRRSTRRA